MFTKTAAVSFDNRLDGLDNISSDIIPKGLYAIYKHTGTIHDFSTSKLNFYNNWLLPSEYTFDNRPFFEILDDKYLGPLNPLSEEMVYIPIKKIN